MDVSEIPYLLERTCYHRDKERLAKCGEAQRAHHQFVKNYQARLVALRRAKLRSTSAVQERQFA